MCVCVCMSDKMGQVTSPPGRLEFNSRSSHTKDSKMVLDTSLLNTRH